MGKLDDNKVLVGRWFTDFWGKTCNLGIVDELAAPNMLCNIRFMNRGAVTPTSRRS
jgi:hypothetical protein